MDALPRRPFLGLRVRPVDGGLAVTGVVADGTGARAGLREGDVIEAVAGRPVRGVSELIEALGAGGEVPLTTRRERARRTVSVAPVPFPIERHEGARVELGAIEVPTPDGPRRWRTIWTTPEAPGPHPAVLLLMGFSVASVDYAGRADEPFAQLVGALAPEAITLRVERADRGDSEGPPPDALDFETEARAYGMAVGALRERSARVVAFGHSLGGMHAPRLAVDARVVYGTSARRWSDCLEASARRQLALRGEDVALAEAAGRFEGAALAERPPAFHAQLDAVDLEAAWRAARGPTLVLEGEHDWVVAEDDAERVAALAPEARHRRIAGADHALTTHPSVDASLRDYGRGPFAREVASVTLAWLRALRSG